MSSRQIFGVVVIVCSTFALTAIASGPTITGTEHQVTTAMADQFDPAISGDIVVYTDFSGVDADVWYTDLATGTAHPITTAPGDQQLTGVSGNLIVFTDWNTMDVLVFHVDTGMTDNLTNAAGSNALDPAVDGTLVAWTDDRHGNADIYARDLTTGEERRITSDAMVDQSPSVGDGLIVFERCDGYACDVFVYDWATAQTRQLTATPWASERFPDVSGRIVVFQREQGTPIDKDLVAVDLDTPGEHVLALAGDQENTHISGDFVAFNNSATGIPHIGLWQLSTGAYFDVTSSLSGQYLNDIDGNRIVYSDNRAGTLDIWMFEFQVETSVDAQLGSLADLVASLNLKRGVENSLDAKLTAAMAALDASRAGATGTACHQLGAFINEVDAQTGKAITAADAAELRGLAMRIRAALGCN